jgi:fatty-acyl-CoA synthase
VHVNATAAFWARWTPCALALTKDAASVSRSDLYQRTRRIAAALQRRGLGAGDRVGILASNSLEWCEMTLAVLHAGAVVVPLNVRLTPAELDYMIAKVDCAAVAVDTDSAPRFAPVAARRPELFTVGLDDRADADVSMGELRSHDDEAEPADVDPGSPAIICFTSGTTGYPKGAVLTHRGVLATAETYSRSDGWGTDTVGLCFGPLAFNGGITNAFLGTFCVGGRLIIETFEPSAALSRIVTDRVTVLTGAPIIYESIAALPEFAAADLTSVRTAVTGGAAPAESLLRAWAAKGVRLRQSYGLTESTGPVTTVPPSHYLSKAYTIGLPLVNAFVRVVDAADTDVPAGDVGEIIVKGPQVMAGYWDDPEATKSAIRGGWLYTGDLGAFDEDGYLSIVGRRNDLIISGGLNVYPAEIERVVRAFEGVVGCVAFGVPHERWGETVALVVEGDVDLGELERYTRAYLAGYKVPRYIGRAEQPLPRNGLGKLLRNVVRDAFDPTRAWRTGAT